jgi:carboxyl-terminal processing protease
VTERELLASAVRGIMDGLDPHSEYLDSKSLVELTELTTGRFGGIGVELGLVDGLITVIAPIDDSPAKRAGLTSGDALVRLDDKPIKGKTLTQIAKALRGEPGTQVRLAIRRDAFEDLLEMELTRSVINVTSVRGHWLEPGYAYVRISQFQTTTPADLQDTLHRLTGATDEVLRGLVLDLRDNPGGVLQASVSVADVFLTDGLIVYTEGRQPSADLRYKATGDDMLAGAPIAILVNHGSASASEVVAGALQDHGRAVVVGKPSFGKGSVQTVLPLDGSRAIKLTTALYYTPDGRSIQHTGIQPDILLDDADTDDHPRDATLDRALAELKSSQG